MKSAAPSPAGTKPCYLNGSVADGAGVGLFWALLCGVTSSGLLQSHSFPGGFWGGCQSHTIQGDLEWLRVLVSRWYRYTLDHLWRRHLSSSWARSLDVLTLSPAHVPWSCHRTNSRWTPVSGCLRCHQRPAVSFPQASHHTIMWAGTTASWRHTTALKHQCYLCTWLTRVQTSPCLVGAGIPALLAGVLMVSSSRHVWKLDYTSASPGNMLWLWLWRMYHFSTTAICHYSFGACMQLRGKSLCTAWTLHGWLCLCVSSTAQGVGTEDHHMVVFVISVSLLYSVKSRLDGVISAGLWLITNC